MSASPICSLFSGTVEVELGGVEGSKAKTLGGGVGFWHAESTGHNRSILLTLGRASVSKEQVLGQWQELPRVRDKGNDPWESLRVSKVAIWVEGQGASVQQADMTVESEAAQSSG